MIAIIGSILCVLGGVYFGYVLAWAQINRNWRVRFQEEELMDVSGGPDKIRYQQYGVIISKLVRDADRQKVTKMPEMKIYTN